MGRRDALLINCSKSQAEKAREFAERERRTISGYVLYIAIRAAKTEERFFFTIDRLEPYPIRRPPGPRTCLLIRCSTQEAKRIRTAAKRRQMTICGYVLYCLERAWHAHVAGTIMAARWPAKAGTQDAIHGNPELVVRGT